MSSPYEQGSSTQEIEVEMNDWAHAQNGKLYTAGVASCTVAVLFNPATKSSYMGHFNAPASGGPVQFPEVKSEGQYALMDMLTVLKHSEEDPAHFLAWLGGSNYSYSDQKEDLEYFFAETQRDREFTFNTVVEAGIPAKSIFMHWNDKPDSVYGVEFDVFNGIIDVQIELEDPAIGEIMRASFKNNGDNWGEL